MFISLRLHCFYLLLWYLHDDGKKLTATTDGFGDFWFEGLEVGKYSLKIEAKGFAAKTIDKISTEEDANLGDIPLSK